METADEQSAGCLVWQSVVARYEDLAQNLKALADEVVNLANHLTKLMGVITLITRGYSPYQLSVRRTVDMDCWPLY
jgi:hypothetical protein